MANLSCIEIEKSIASGRLSLNLSRLDKVLKITDTFLWSTLCIPLIVYPILTYFHLNIKSSTDGAVSFVLYPLIILFGLYGLYRKLTENKLISIDASSTRHKNKEYLLEYLTQNSYEVFRESKDVVIVNVEESLSFNKLWTKTITFIIDDRRIYFAMVKNYTKINPPVFITHCLLKKELLKYLKSK